jgi:superfamily II DNA helicase RecQ
LNKKNSKSKKILEKMSNLSETDENIESKCKNESEPRNDKIIPANMNTTLDENSVSTSNSLQTTETQTKLSDNDNEERSNSSVDPPGKELSTAQKSNANEEEKLSLVSGSESLKNEAELNTTTQQLKVPLKMVLKLKSIVDNVTLSFKTNESSSEKISKVSNVLTTNNCSSGNVDENINVISNDCVDVLGNERGLDESEKLLAKNGESELLNNACVINGAKALSSNIRTMAAYCRILPTLGSPRLKYSYISG